MIRAQCEVLSNRRSGAYHSLTLVAPDIAEKAKPGQFVEIYMAKTKTPIRTKGKGIKLDDDDDLRGRPEVVMIVILQEAPKQ